MPAVLSLPLPVFSTGLFESLPVRVPFPFMRIASILPHAINEPIKNSLLALFKLAWSAKVQLPVLITVCFMAFDIRLQLEINIFWETNNARHVPNDGNRNAGQRRASREEMRRIATAASGVYQQQRRRLIQEIRAVQAREREQSARQSLPVQTQGDAPLATLEDSDIDDSLEGSESETITCSQRSVVSEAGSFATDEEADDPPPRNGREIRKRKRMTKFRISTKEQQPNDNEEDETDDDDDDDDYTTTDDDEDDDDDNVGGGGASSSHGGAGNGYSDDPYDPDSDSMDNSGDAGGGNYSSPLVVEVEIRHRASRFIQNASSSSVASNSYVFRKTISNEFQQRFRKFNNYIFTYTPMYFSPCLK